MERRYAVLQKKVEEIESAVCKLFHDESTVTRSQAWNNQDDNLLEAIGGKIAFAKRLLTAEMVVHPEKKPHHLHQIEKRLAVSETAFFNWVDFQTSPFDSLDALSACSCTGSCFNQEEDGPSARASVLDEREEKEDPETVSCQEFKETRLEEEKQQQQQQEEEEDPDAFSCQEVEEAAAKAISPPPEPEVVSAFEREKEKGRRFWVGRSGRLMGGLMFAVVVGVVTAAATGFSVGVRNHGENVFLVPT